MKKFLLPLLLGTLLLSSCGKSDMQLIRERTIEQYLNDLQSPAYQAYKLTRLQKGEPVDSLQYLQEQTAKLDEKVKECLATIQPDGSWKDIDYACKLRNDWSPSLHLNRISQMTKAYSLSYSTYYQNEELLTDILKALDFWSTSNPRSTNWWHNEIGGPMTIGPVYLTLQDKMSPEQLDAAVRYMDNAKIKITGQNKVWLCSNVMIRAMLTNDLPLFEEAIQGMKSVIKVENGEGVQYDWSFHQHGRQQQFGNYGLSFPSSLISRGRLFLGTRYAFNDQEMGILRNYLLKGMSWVIWKDEMDVNSLGRQLFYNNAMVGKANTYGQLLMGMEELDPANKAMYDQMFREQILGEPNTLVGINHFFMSDMTVMRKSDWMASLKMQSDRTVGTETVNMENLLNQVMANGAIYLYQDGGEYNNIFPIWDWTRIPGVTCNFASQNDYPTYNRRIKGKTQMVGGLTDENYGVSAMRVEADGLVANKSWYFTDQYILCLGSDIESHNGNPVATGINQAFKKGDAQVKMYGKPGFEVRNEAHGAVEAVLHAGIGYYFAPGQNATLRVGEQTGSWHNVHADSPDTPVTGEVFNLALNHGRDPKAASYEYVLIPRCDEAKMNDFCAQQDFTILKNSDDVHAVRFADGTVRSIFFTTRGTLKVDDKIEVLHITEEAILVFRREGNHVFISYVDPTTEKDSIIITFKGKWEADNVYYDPETDTSVVELDTKISWGKRLEAQCDIVG